MRVCPAQGGLFNLTGPAPPTLRIGTNVTIPLLDDSLSPAEVECQAKRMKVDKGCVQDGLTPDSPNDVNPPSGC